MDLSARRGQALKLGEDITNEVVRAMTLFPSIHNPHEALGVIREEYIELESEIFRLNLCERTRYSSRD